MNAGAANVSATDSRNVPTSSTHGDIHPAPCATANAAATSNAATWVVMMNVRRSSMSANAPACSASRKPGTAHEACTRLTRVGELDSVAIVQLAATRCMKVPTFETRPAIHSQR